MRFYNGSMLMEGIFAAVTTPFYPDERVYFRKLEANMARYSRSLLAGMLVLGSTGEAVALDDEESRDVLRVAAEASAAEKVLVAGVARESVKGTVELAEAAAGLNYDAVLVRTPTYYAAQMTPQPFCITSAAWQTARPCRYCSTTFPSCVPYDIPVDLSPSWRSTPTSLGSRTRAEMLRESRRWLKLLALRPGVP